MKFLPLIPWLHLGPYLCLPHSKLCPQNDLYFELSICLQLSSFISFSAVNICKSHNLLLSHPLSFQLKMSLFLLIQHTQKSCSFPICPGIHVFRQEAHSQISLGKSHFYLFVATTKMAWFTSHITSQPFDKGTVIM